MRKTEAGVKLTQRNQFVRMCIAKALFALMKKKPLEEITITELVKKACVSRMTFYKYYKSKLDVLEDYMYEIVNAYMEECKKRDDIGKLHEFKHICHCFEFFQQYSPFIQTLVNSNMYSVIINALNSFMDVYVLPQTIYSRYELYYYAGALCNTYIKWIESGSKESPEEIARMVYKNISGN